MNDEERFVKSIYPHAFIDITVTGKNRICSEPTMRGHWIGGVCCSENPWFAAAEYIRTEMIWKLES